MDGDEKESNEGEGDEYLAYYYLRKYRKYGKNGREKERAGDCQECDELFQSDSIISVMDENGENDRGGMRAER